MLHQLLYVSGAIHPMSADDIEGILKTSRRNNSVNAITGMLLYRSEVFLQVLEGPRAAVRKLYSRIETDPRHRNSMVMMERDASDRAFGEWSMGFDYMPNRSEHDERSFSLSRAALEGRIASHAEGGVMLDTVLAFAKRDFLGER
ncbi:BLUF domain-containing protein [Mesorhizobium sp. RP14(2022)]|uniref:BLUF domain-containing protein n=1 Tax=Mesorhizobium liriopis TaxID=2953882 RepID=A0ABT1CC38_9HYPH|nr:BLUF domain-containing protein [Mesorhizobium liriopis]MCO6051725.1 BLUF domain-containing protein [Mesorhizobium liriopis]